MNRRSFVTSALALPVAACANQRKQWVLRHRLAVQIHAGGRIFTGESVSETRTWQTGPLEQVAYFPFKAPVINGDAEAEAAVIDLGDRGLLVALLGNVLGVGYGDRIGGTHFNPMHIGYRIGRSHLTRAPLDADGEIGLEYEMARALRSAQPWPIEFWPIFVHFSDPTDVRSVRLVFVPDQPVVPRATVVSTTLADLCGAAAAIHVTVQATDDPVSTGILTRLPWLTTFRGSKSNHTGMISGDGLLHENLVFQNFKRSKRR